MIFKPRLRHNHWHNRNSWRQGRRHWKQQRYQNCGTNNYAGASAATTSTEDVLEVNVVFGAVKKNIISKDLKGGEINVVFGGTELNFNQADFNDKITIEVNVVFGGTKLIVPSNWTVKSEVVTIFGGMEDKRNSQTLADSPEKLLLLKGTVIFGGIDIKSF